MKEKKMPKWEEKYNNYNIAEADKKIEELEVKLNNKAITKEEYNELNTEKRIRDNYDKVQNLLELRSKLSKQKMEIQKELDKVSIGTKAYKELVEIEKELEKLNEERTKVNIELKEMKAQKEKLTKQLKNPALKDDEKAKIEEELNKLNKEEKEKKEGLETKQRKNDEKYLKNRKIYEESKETSKQFEGKNPDELKKAAFEIGTKISKINMVANNLMQGKSWNSIEIALDNWKDREFTSKEKITELAKGNTEVTKGNSIDNTQTVNKTGKVEETSLVEQTEFQKKHPRLAKLVNNITSLKDKFINIFKKDDKTANKATGKPDKGTTDGKNEPAKKEEQNEFKKYLKEIAEKGMEQVEKDQELAKMERVYGHEKTQEILEARKKREERMAKGGFKAVDSKAGLKYDRVYKGEDR